MAKYILLGFVVLAWVFYEASGGRDFVPNEPDKTAQDDAQTEETVKTAKVLEPEYKVAVTEEAHQQEAPLAEIEEPKSLADADTTETAVKTQEPETAAKAVTETDVSEDDATTEAPTAVAYAEETVTAIEEVEAVSASFSPSPETDVKEPTTALQIYQAHRQRMFSASKLSAPRQLSDKDPASSIATNGDALEAATSTEGDTVLDLRKVRANRVNMRGGPGVSYMVLGQLERGAQVVVLEDSGRGWLKLEALESSDIGWVSERMLTTME